MRILVTANTTIGTKLLLFDLRNIEVAHIQTRMFLDIFPDFLIGSSRFRSGHVQFIHFQVNGGHLVWTKRILPRQLFQFPREVLSLPHHQQAQEN